MMAQKMISDCICCRLPADADAHRAGIAEKHPGNFCSCAPVIDAEKSNEALRMVALIRNHTGSGFMAFTAE